jgi:membrane fusion protein, multidrug efflux system
VFSVPEDRLAGIQALLGKPGAVKLKLWSQESQPLLATVREIAAATDPATRTFLVKADAGAAPLRLGQTASVLVEQPRRAGVVKLPLAAVFEHQGRSAVWVLEPTAMTLRLQPIEVAGADGSQVLVAQGLAAGQRVVSAGVHVLTPGQKVTLYAEPVPGAGSAPARR